MKKQLVSLCAVLPLCAGAAEPLSLADAAERFAERSASLPQGSVRAQSIDRQIPLGNCASGWMWSFPYEARTTVQVACTASPTPSRRLIAVRYLSTDSRSETPTSAGASNKNVVVVTRDLPVGSILGANDLEVVPVSSKDRAFASTLSEPGALLGLALTRSVREGERLGRADARPVQIIKRNAPVTAWTSFPGGRVMAKLVALQNGKADEWIDLENPQSGRRLRGLVQADGTVRINAVAPSGNPQTLASRVD